MENDQEAQVRQRSDLNTEHGDSMANDPMRQSDLHQETQQLNARIAQLTHRIEALEADYNAVVNSRVWRACAPFRRILVGVRRIPPALGRIVSVIRRKGLIATGSSLYRIIRSEGLVGVLARTGIRSNVRIGIDDSDYISWVALYDAPSANRRAQIETATANLAHRPVISIVMPTFNPDLRHLDEAIRSVREQVYSHWQLCIADDLSTDPGVKDLLTRHAAEDDRIKLVFRSVNGHICAATNSALEQATGPFVALFDHDDLLPDHALYYVAKAINEAPNGKIFYSDEDKVTDAGIRCQPYFKSDWNYDLFLSHNVVSHLGVYDRELVHSIGGFREGLHGSQDWDLALRASECVTAEQIIHIPRILYHWRIHPQSTSAAGQSAKPYAYTAAETALNDHLRRSNVDAQAVFLPNYGAFRIKYALPEPQPLVSLVIPTRNGGAHLSTCIDSILERTTYSNFEILVVDNGSDEPASLTLLEEIAGHPQIRVIPDPGPFNYSRINNSAVAQSAGAIIALLNDDVAVINPEWLSDMVSIAVQPGVGAVGAKLIYENNTVQHAGIILGVNGIADHSHRGIPRQHPGYFSKAMLTQSFSAVTAACMVLRKDVFLEVDGFDEVNLPVAFNDVDLCLKLKYAGYRNVWTPDAELYHYESLTRGSEDTPEKSRRFRTEMAFMRSRWSHALEHDFAYNPNLDHAHADYQLAWPPNLPSLPEA